MADADSMDTAIGSGEDLVYFVDPHPENYAGFTPHRDSGEILARRLDELQEDWRVIAGQVRAMVSSAESEAGSDGFRIAEVSVGLAFSARGRLAFIAEADVEASVTVTLKRN